MVDRVIEMYLNFLLKILAMCKIQTGDHIRGDLQGRQKCRRALNEGQLETSAMELPGGGGECYPSN
jgi:hypothetical protein